MILNRENRYFDHKNNFRARNKQKINNVIFKPNKKCKFWYF